VARANTLTKIPKDRIGALIGPEGKVKQTIEKRLKVELTIDSETGDIVIKLAPESDDPSLLFRAQEVITAIGRGFTPEGAFRLIDDEELLLEVIDLRETFGTSQSELQRVKGRLIGQEGKTRRIIEELTEADVSIHGHTVAIIADMDQMEIAREAVKMILRGSMHSTVYRYLNRKRRELKKKKLELWEKPYETPDKQKE
jgi:ribosomal RNA assembly protein